MTTRFLTLALAVAIAGAAASVLFVRDRWIARIERRTGKKIQTGRPWYEPVREVMGRILLGLFALLAVLGLVRWIRAGMPIGRETPLALTYFGILAVSIVVIMGLWVLVSLILLHVRNNDRDVAAAVAIATQGDIERAIAELRAVIETQGPSVTRLNAIGMLYLLRESWDEAITACDEAIRLGGRQPLLLGNRALALRKLGRPEEAVELFTEAIEREKINLVLQVNRCHALIDLGRLDEARADLDRAEAIQREAPIILAGKATRDEIARQDEQRLADCRSRLAESGLEKKDDLTCLDEL